MGFGRRINPISWNFRKVRKQKFYVQILLKNLYVFRMQRKAELARKSRRKRKLYVQNLEKEAKRLEELILKKKKNKHKYKNNYLNC